MWLRKVIKNTSFICFSVLVTPYTLETEKVTTFTYRAPESKQDVRYHYDTKLMRLALEKTIDTDGPFKLIASPKMNYDRANATIRDNTLPNFFIKNSYQVSYDSQSMAYVPFPVDLGIVGYRVCFAHPVVVKQLEQVTSIKALKKFTHGQGNGWADVDILRHNGFQVDISYAYENLFHMVALRRFDLFCRGINEFLSELKGHLDIHGLAYDQTIAITYPLPRFLYTNSNNTSALDRLHRGILIAYKDGSLHALWRKQYQPSIDYVRLTERRIFALENPLLKNLDFNYQQYFYSPVKSAR